MPRPLRVMIVEDNEDLRGVLALLIGDQPDLQCVAQSAAVHDVLPLSAQHDPDVVLLDIELHGQSSIPLVSQLRNERPHTRVVIYSGHGGAAFIKQVLAAGADAFVSKAGDPDDLLGAIRNRQR